MIPAKAVYLLDGYPAIRGGPPRLADVKAMFLEMKGSQAEPQPTLRFSADVLPRFSVSS